MAYQIADVHRDGERRGELVSALPPPRADQHFHNRALLGLVDQVEVVVGNSFQPRREPVGGLLVLLGQQTSGLQRGPPSSAHFFLPVVALRSLSASRSASCGFDCSVAWDAKPVALFTVATGVRGIDAGSLESRTINHQVGEVIAV